MDRRTMIRRRAGRLLVTVVALPHLTGCFSMLPTPIPTSPAEREELGVRGVVIDDGTDNGDGERIEFTDIQSVSWTPESVSIVGVARSGETAGRLAERRFQLSALSAVLVRQVDPGRTSAIIGVLLVGAAAVVAFVVTGKAEQY